jgi:trimethylamine---corrinoid protein Co-methyltransferase
MKKGYVSQAVPRYRLFTEEQIREIHLATLDVLETVGVRVLHEGGIQLLKEHGCRVENENVVHFPNWLVEACLHSAPRRVTLYNRKGEEAMRLEGYNNYFGLGTDLIYTIDVHTGKMRPSVLQDVANAARVVDACKDIDFTASFALPGDVPVNSMYMHCVKTMMENTLKPIFFTAAGKEDLEYILRMAEAVSGSEQALREKPFLIHYSEPTSPLSHSYGAVNKLFLCAEKGIPINYTTGALLGGTLPVTLAGAIVQANAEILSGIVLHQLKSKGAPIITGWVTAPMDMRTTTILYGAPELRLGNSAFAEMLHHYGIPMWSTVGSDANSMDEQAAYENAFGTLLSALDGANLIHDVGYMGQGKIGNPAMIVMGDEMISYTRRLLRGFEISWDKIGLENIRQAGPNGHYLDKQHTLDNFRGELWRSSIANREMLDPWMEKGSIDYGEAARRKALKILETHQVEPLPKDVAEKVNALAAEADKVLAKVQFIA